jgi:uncharacterized 2Fe-2S/4Fe-4S cluster protein (DUF4445 family)
VEIESACGGKGNCGKCRVELEPPDAGTRIDDGAGQSAAGGSSGDAARPGLVSPPTEVEARLLGAELLATGFRLACQARVQGDLRVLVPLESRRSTQVGTKEARQRSRRLDPAVRAYSVGLPSPWPRDPAGVGQDLLSALAHQHGLTSLETEPEALESLRALAGETGAGGRPAQETLVALLWRGSGQDVTAAEGAATGGATAGDTRGTRPAIGKVLDVRPATSPGRLLGLAVDVGTTTIAVYLADLSTGEILATESALNPQVAFGDDLITRLQHAAHNPGGGAELQHAVVAEINRLGREAAKHSRTDAGDIVDVVMVGNTVMHHLFLGLDTGSLRVAPFTPALREAMDTKASAVGLAFHPACRLYALPNEAGFVGADNVAVIIAEEPYHQDEAALLIDVGTNGELVLGDRRRMLSASCATGPAFEGAHIEHGMRATPGAIERIRIEPETLKVKFKVIGTDAWITEPVTGKGKARGICGSGVIEAAAEMLKTGVIRPDGGFNPDLTHERVLLEDGRPRKFVIAREEETATGRPITVSLKDIRAIQLGKAALRAGAEILLRRYGTQRPNRVVLAGAFGSYIDKHAALAIGMLPACDPDRVTSVGNAAGDGALLALLDVGKRREAEWAAEAVEYVELASVPEFQQEYVKAMRFEPSGTGP